jgi:hypothetical protein
MELSSSWEAASRSATQEFPNMLWHPKVQHRIHKSHPLVPILGKVNLAYNIYSIITRIKSYDNLKKIQLLV